MGVMYAIQPGDTLTEIAEKECGSWRQYEAIYKYNFASIENKDLIYPGVYIILPCKIKAQEERVPVKVAKDESPEVTKEEPTPLALNIENSRTSQLGQLVQTATDAPNIGLVATELVSEEIAKLWVPSKIEALMPTITMGKEDNMSLDPTVSTSQLEQLARTEMNTSENVPVVEPAAFAEYSAPQEQISNHSPAKLARKTEKKMNPLKKILSFITWPVRENRPVRLAKWPLKNKRRIAGYGLNGVRWAPIPYSSQIAMSGMLALSLTAPSGPYAAFAAPAPVSEEAIFQAPDRELVEKAGKTPYLRYTVPAGELVVIDNAIFNQKAYDGSDTVKGLKRLTAGEIGLVGVLNEIPDQAAVLVDLSPAAILYVHPETNEPLYLHGCTYKGKPHANRIRAYGSSKATMSSQGANTATATATAPGINIPPQITLNMTGLPQAAAVPTNTTQRIIYEGEVVQRQIIQEGPRDRFRKLESVGKAVRDTGIGVGVAALGIKLPGAIENSAHAKAGAVRYSADRNVDIATINGVALVDAAKNRVPDQLNLSNISKVAGNNNPVNTQDAVVSPEISNVAHGGTAKGGSSSSSSTGGNGYGGQGGLGGNAENVATNESYSNSQTGPVTSTSQTAPVNVDASSKASSDGATATTGPVTTGPVTANGGVSSSVTGPVTTGPVNVETGEVKVDVDNDSSSNSKADVGPIDVDSNSNSNSTGGNVGNVSSQGGNATTGPVTANGGQGGKAEVIGSGNSKSDSNSESGTKVDVDNNTKVDANANGGNVIGSGNSKNDVDANSKSESGSTSGATSGSNSGSTSGATANPTVTSNSGATANQSQGQESNNQNDNTLQNSSVNNNDNANQNSNSNANNNKANAEQTQQSNNQADANAQQTQGQNQGQQSTNANTNQADANAAANQSQQSTNQNNQQQTANPSANSDAAANAGANSGSTATNNTTNNPPACHSNCGG